MKIKILSNPTKLWARELSDELKSLLRSNGHQIVRSAAEVTVCIGGDGTILYAHHKNRLEGNILGIGSKTSYICQLTNESWREKILSILENNETMPVMSLRAKINGKIIEAINDIVIHSSNYRVVRVDVQYEDKKQSFEGDGIIVCSPIGSAAYAYSAGGEKIPLSENKIGIVGICPYKKAFCPVIINADNFVKISTSKSALIADGILISYLKPNSQIIIEKGRDIMFYRQIAHHD